MTNETTTAELARLRARRTQLHGSPSRRSQAEFELVCRRIREIEGAERQAIADQEQMDASCGR